MSHFKIIIPEMVHKKVIHWVNKTNIEVSGFGKVVYDSEAKTLTVQDAYLLEQEGGAAHTDIEARALSKLMYESRALPGMLNWWWHSHVNMDVFWSTTDQATIKELAQHGWSCATVFNKREETRSALCYKVSSEFGSSVHMMDDIGTEILQEIPEDIIAKWDEDFARNVKEKPITPYNPTHGYTGSIYDYETQGEFPSLYTGTAHKVDHGPFNTSHFDRWLEDFKKDDLTHGLVGYGLEVEAEAVKMTKKQFFKLINSKEYFQIYKVANTLENKIFSGEMDRLYEQLRG